VGVCIREAGEENLESADFLLSLANGVGKNQVGRDRVFEFSCFGLAEISADASA